jgi:hypothetical protein
MYYEDTIVARMYSKSLISQVEVERLIWEPPIVLLCAVERPLTPILWPPRIVRPSPKCRPSSTYSHMYRDALGQTFLSLPPDIAEPI